MHAPGTITVRNHARIRHAVAKGVLALLDIAGIDARGSNANTNFSGRWSRVRHLADDQHFASGSLLFVPCRLHISSLEFQNMSREVMRTSPGDPRSWLFDRPQ